MEAIGLLLNFAASIEQPEPAVTLSLLGDILNRFSSSDSEDQKQLVEVTSKSQPYEFDCHCTYFAGHFGSCGDDCSKNTQYSKHGGNTDKEGNMSV